MYTLQSGQIENALRAGGAGDVSAKQMVQQLANCQQVLEHRGNVALSKPVLGTQEYFPTLAPASNNVSFPFTYKNVYLTVPPFQMKEWTPQPFVPLPPWQNAEYPPWPDWGWQGLDGSGAPPTAAAGTGGKPLQVPGGCHLGPTTAREITCGPIDCTDLEASGRARVAGDLQVGRDAYIDGDLHVGGDLSVQDAVTLNGAVTMAGPVICGGTLLSPFTARIVTDVFWDAGSLKATWRTFRIFGVAQGEETETVIAGTECP